MTSKAIIKKLQQGSIGIYESYLLTNGGWSGSDPWDLTHPMQFFGDTVQALEHLKNISKSDDVYLIELVLIKE